jgi:hypothetical protein
VALAADFGKRIEISVSKGFLPLVCGFDHFTDSTWFLWYFCYICDRAG